jgi:hypothetical protein
MIVITTLFALIPLWSLVFIQRKPHSENLKAVPGSRRGGGVKRFNFLRPKGLLSTFKY